MYLFYSISDYYIKRNTNVKYIGPSDNRISRLNRELLNPLGNIIGDVKRIDTNVLLSGMVNHRIYVADLIIYSSVGASLLRFGTSTFQKNSQVTVILIHPPNHYVQAENILIGREVMRIRQMKKMGFRVMNVQYTRVNKLLPIPLKLQEYLQDEYKNAQKE